MPNDLAGFLYRIGTKKQFNLGQSIFDQVITFIHLREQKVKLPFPNMIYGIITAQGLTPLGHEIVRSSLLYKVNERLLGGKHVKDVKSMVPLEDTPMADQDEEALTPYLRDLKQSKVLKVRVA